jgi:hypothetical protein
MNTRAYARRPSLPTNVLSRQVEWESASERPTKCESRLERNYDEPWPIALA